MVVITTLNKLTHTLAEVMTDAAWGIRCRASPKGAFCKAWLLGGGKVKGADPVD